MLLCGNLDLKEIDISRCSLVFLVFCFCFLFFFLFCRLAVCVFDILVVPGLP